MKNTENDKFTINEFKNIIKKINKNKVAFCDGGVIFVFLNSESQISNILYNPSDVSKAVVDITEMVTVKTEAEQ